MTKQRVPRGYGKIAIRTRSGRVVLPSPVKGERTVEDWSAAFASVKQRKTITIKGRLHWRSARELRHERIRLLADWLMDYHRQDIIDPADLLNERMVFLGERITRQEYEAAIAIMRQRLIKYGSLRSYNERRHST